MNLAIITQVFFHFLIDKLPIGFLLITCYLAITPVAMKKIIISALILFTAIYFLSACKKNESTAIAPDQPVDPVPPVSNSCTATKTAAENIAIFPGDNSWNKDISASAIDPYSTRIVAGFASNVIKADFGTGLWENAPIGIPYIVVCGNQPKIPVTFTDYGDESDAGPYPIPLTTPIEGNGNGDSHVIAVDIENGMLYELFNAHVSRSRWDASSGAIFNLKTNTMRTDGWTSADAAGLPIFPGLVRYDEIVKGVIDHPIRFTLSSSLVKPAYIYPARHKVSSSGGQYSLPFGARIRLKDSFNVSSYSATNQIILKALKKYGLILADIGSNLYVSGAPDQRWNNDDLRKLGQLHGSDFEVVKFNN